MRFAYIDSQGKEVGIPSVEALQLRIELGAISDDTMFHDTNADKWAPASEHEIYRSLAREAEGRSDGGFVAAPPSMLRLRMPKMDEPAEPAPPPAEPTPPPAAAPPPPAAPPPVAEAPPVPAPPVEPVAPAADPGGFDLGDFGTIDLAPDAAAPSEPAPAEPPAAAPVADAGGFDLADFGSFDLAEAPPEPERAHAPSPPDQEEPDLTSGFDFGDMGAIEVDAAPVEEEEPVPNALGGLTFDAPGTGGGMDLERPLTEYAPDEDSSFEGAGDSGLQFEDATTTAHQSSSSTPARPQGAGGPLERRGDAGDGADDETPERTGPRRPPRARPAPPRPRPKKSPVGAIAITLVAVAVVGGGGFFGWKAFMSGPSGPAQDTVTIDAISPELQPRFLQLSSQAYGTMLDSLRARVAAAGLPEGPPREWLQGVYLANASQYVALTEYWEAVEGALEDLRDADLDGSLFLDAYDAGLEATFPVDPEIQDTLRSRGQQGYEAARRDRSLVYDQLQAIINASLDLHDLLVANEDNIEHQPASGGVSRDPVTEAVPTTEALGAQMWGGVDAIQKALGEMDALGQVPTTDNLMRALFSRLAVTPIR